MLVFYYITERLKHSTKKQNYVIKHYSKFNAFKPGLECKKWVIKNSR